MGNLLYTMRVGEKNVKRRVVLALAHLCCPNDQKTIFIDKDGIPLFHIVALELSAMQFLIFKHSLSGLSLLLELLESPNSIHQRESSMALCRLANKANSLIPMDAAPLSPTPQVTVSSLSINTMFH